MERRQVPTMLGPTAAQRRRGAVRRPGVYQPNFGRLSSDASWRTTWSAIIAGKFTPSPYSGLLFVEEATGYAELYDTDGSGRLQAPFLRQYSPLGERASWTHIVPGFYGPSGFTGLLLYDQAAGFGRFYDSNGQGDFVLRNEYSGWRTTWTHIVSGRFVASSKFSSIFFYSALENYGEIWAADGAGLAGAAPLQTFPDFSSSPFTHVLAGEFHWTPGYIDEVPTLTDLFFYDGAAGRGEMYRCGMPEGSTQLQIVPVPAATSDSLPLHATSVAAGSFGGVGNADLAFYDAGAGKLSIYSFFDTSDTAADLVLRETRTGLRTTANLIVSGNFWMSNPEDHWFDSGPPTSATPPFDPEWRFGNGGFSDFLFYDRNAGLGEFYFHEPKPPDVPPLEGYITSQTAHGGAPQVSTGSVLPGESIAFHISSQEGPYSITIYRQAIFAGDHTEQAMASIEALPNGPTPFPIGRTAYKDGAEWPAAAQFIIPQFWPSGLYVARVQAAHAPDSIDLEFVVRAPSQARMQVLLVLADCTYCAYNDWGGRNSYGHLTAADFAGAFPSTSALRIPFGFQLSFERPLHGGFGNRPQSWEIPLVWWLSRRGVAVDVCTARDLHFDAPDTHPYRLMLFAGHHEYWTAEMRNNVERFAAAGGNVAFFSGNVCWWQIRLSADGRALTCYKVAGFDPVSTTAEHALTTVHWFDDLVKRPETALTGVSWLAHDGGIFNDPDHRFTVKRADHWVFSGTGLKNEDKFGGYGGTGADEQSVAGAETDRVQIQGPNGLTTPAGYTLASVYDLANPKFEVGAMGIFRAPGDAGGETFNAATINWALGLNHDEHSWNVIDQITLNVISRLGPPRPSPWTSVSDGQTRPGAPIAAVLTDQNHIAVFLADPAGGVFTTSGDATHGWRPWTSVSEGRSTPGAAITAIRSAPNRVSLFLADPAGGVYTTSGNASDGWRPWTSVSEGQSTPGAPMSAVVTEQNRIVLFLADPGGGVYANALDAQGAGQEWTAVPGDRTTPGAPVTAILSGPDQILLFMANSEGAVVTTSGNPDQGWEPWTSVSDGRSTPGGPITAVATGANRIALFLTDLAGNVYTVSGNGAGWDEWTSVAAGQTTPGASVAAVVPAIGRVTLFLADAVGAIYATTGNASDGWQPWTSVSEGRSTPGAPVAALITAQTGIALFLADGAGVVYTAMVPPGS